MLWDFYCTCLQFFFQVAQISAEKHFAMLNLFFRNCFINCIPSHSGIEKLHYHVYTYNSKRTHYYQHRDCSQKLFLYSETICLSYIFSLIITVIFENVTENVTELLFIPLEFKHLIQHILDPCFSFHKVTAEITLIGLER